MKKCPGCGIELENDAVKCSSCGYSFEQVFEFTQEQKPIEQKAERLPEEINNGIDSSDSPKIKKPPKRNFEKKPVILIGITAALSIGLLVSAVNIGKLNKKADNYKASVDEALEENEKLNTDLDAKTSENEKLNNEIATIQSKYDEISDEYTKTKTEYAEYKKEMKPYEEMEAAEAEQRKAEAEAQKKEKENQKIATAAVEKVWDFEAGTLKNGATKELCADAEAKVNALTDEQVKQSLLEAVTAARETIAAQEQAAAEEEARGYETGISYDQLARTPDDYIGEKCKFSGKVAQVMESDGVVVVRLAVNSDYDTILYCMFNSSIMSTRILEDDNITVYGSSAGIYTYESTWKQSISIPSMIVDKIDQ